MGQVIEFLKIWEWCSIELVGYNTIVVEKSCNSEGIPDFQFEFGIS